MCCPLCARRLVPEDFSKRLILRHTLCPLAALARCCLLAPRQLTVVTGLCRCCSSCWGFGVEKQASVSREGSVASALFLGSHLTALAGGFGPFQSRPALMPLSQKFANFMRIPDFPLGFHVFDSFLGKSGDHSRKERNEKGVTFQAEPR